MKDDVTEDGAISSNFTVTADADPIYVEIGEDWEIEVSLSIASNSGSNAFSVARTVTAETSGVTVDGGQVTSLEAEPVTVEKFEQTYSSGKVTLLPGEGEEFVRLRFTITVPVDLNDLTMEAGSQEIRTGREYVVKTAYYEITGTIVSIDR